MCHTMIKETIQEACSWPLETPNVTPNLMTTLLVAPQDSREKAPHCTGNKGDRERDA